MRVLQIGGGSMGTRRMRDLSAQPGIEIRLLDGREDRRSRALATFGIAGFRTLVESLAWDPEIFIVSTPPDQHTELVRLAVETGRHVFSEADIWPADPDIVVHAERAGVVFAPSATLLFHPVVEDVSRIVRHELGATHAFGYLLSVDAPSWHPDEGEEYYARHRATSPAREMTAFELIGIHGIVGPTRSVSGRVERRGALAGTAEDTFGLQLVTDTGVVGQLTVLMASPQVARRGWVVGENGFVAFDLLAGNVERRLPGAGIDDVRHVADWAAVLEEVYDTEICTFIAAVAGQVTWPFPGGASANVCGTLGAAELSMVTGCHETVHPGQVPAAQPDQYQTP